jgi:hypothetical protein
MTVVETSVLTSAALEGLARVVLAVVTVVVVTPVDGETFLFLVVTVVPGAGILGLPADEELEEEDEEEEEEDEEDEEEDEEGEGDGAFRF